MGAEHKMTRRIQLRRDIETNWTEVNPILTQGEVGVDLTSNKIKIGDGIKTWTQLEYLGDTADLTGYATEEYVSQEIAGIIIPTDISDLTDTDGLLTGEVPVDLSGYALITDIPDVSNFITAEDIPTDYKGSVFADDSTLLVDAVNASIPYSVLSGTPTIPTDIADLTDTTNMLGGSANSLFNNNDITVTVSNEDSSSYTWNFGNTGGLVFPDNTIQNTAYISGSGLASRSTASGSTGSIANAATANVTITGFKGYLLYKIQTSAAAWVRLYTSVAARTADSSRLENEDPLPGAGVIAEIISTSAETMLITPGTIGFNDESSPNTNIELSVTNKSGSTADITVTLTIVKVEV